MQNVSEAKMKMSFPKGNLTTLTSRLVVLCCVLVWSNVASFVASASASALIYPRWMWVGGLDSSSAVVKARLSGPLTSTNVTAVVDVEWRDSTGGTKHTERFKASHVGEFHVASIPLYSLPEDTDFTYSVMVIDEDEGHTGSVPTHALHGKFHTPKSAGTPMDFSFGFASCADNHSNAIIFDVIREHNPLFFMHMGDLHYGNVEQNDPALFHYMYDQVMANDRQAHFFRDVPLSYMFDDHDFGPNNSDESSPGRESSIAAYLEAVPFYPLPAYQGISERIDQMKRLPSVYYGFTVGRVRFLVTDTSSSKRGEETALGAEQLAWFLQALRQAASDPAVAQIVWVSTMPWVTIHDKWAVFHEDRRQIVQTIDELGIRNRLVQLAGDAHMLALDDGTHVAGGFPVFQAASLDAKPTCKGGPYSHGIYPGRGQYGWLQVRDDGSKICLYFQGRRVNLKTGAEQTMLAFDTCDSSRNTPRHTYIPSPPWVERIWKDVKKKFIPPSYMVFFDSFTVSLYMVFVQYIIPSIAAIPACVFAIHMLRRP